MSESDIRDAAVLHLAALMQATRVPTNTIVMPGLDPGIHRRTSAVPVSVDGRVKPGHDGLL
jgi:hypothetical protein